MKGCCAAACMTWDLAESGNDFITTVVNRDDLVPSFGKGSAAILRTKVSYGYLISSIVLNCGTHFRT